MLTLYSLAMFIISLQPDTQIEFLTQLYMNGPFKMLVDNKCAYTPLMYTWKMDTWMDGARLRSMWTQLLNDVL
jgi:hypothetical protein